MSDQLATLDSRTAIGLVAQRELMTRLRSRVFIVGLASSVFLVLAVFGLVRLVDGGPPSLTVGLVGEQPAGIEASVDTRAEGSGGEVALEPFADRAAARTALDAGEIDAFVVAGDEVVVNELSNQIADLIVPPWQQARLADELAGSGASDVTIAAALEPLTVTEVAADDREARGTLAFAIVVMLFLAIQVSGAYIMMGTIEEKSTKVVEIVLSSIRARDLLMGKLLGIGVIALVQVVALAATGVAASAAFDSSALGVLDVSMLVSGVLWFLVGYALWASVFAAASSLSTGMEDAQATMTPVSIAILLAYLGAIYTATNPTSTGARVLSWIPPAAPFAMPGRIAGSDVPVWEIVAVFALTTITTYGVVRLAARIYVRSVLQLDKRIGWLDAFHLEED